MLHTSVLTIRLNQSVTGIPASTLVLDENAPIEQNFNIPQRRVPGTFSEFGIFRCRELAFKTIQQPVDYLALPFIDL
jgi:hypothetical protein